MTALLPSRLARHGDRPALLSDGRTITYAELGARVARVADRLGSARRLVALAMANEPDAVVHYLAALEARHPVILIDARNAAALDAVVDTYDPDVVVRPSGSDDTWRIEERRHGTRHSLHPELALLLSTSGSTGSPKLVRLSRANLAANAASIATSLRIGPDDRAATTLPMAYCYGLSVINSHLLRGGSVVLTDRSVIEPAFWELVQRHEVTSFAGVPYTFDLLDRVGFAELELPHLRQVTQAGGRLDPAAVRRYAELGHRRGWDLVVMYGQTEATARMAVLPPHLAVAHPESIGVAIPGGSLRLEPFDGAPDGAGELVYRGPNVMLGYAEGPLDLGRGREVAELRTGDIGRRGPDGLFQIVGRRAEFLKIAGLRVDPSGVERVAGRLGARACAVGRDEELVVFTEPGAPDDLGARIRDAVCLPAHAVRVVTIDELPRLPNGKPDRAAMRRMADAKPAAMAAPAQPATRDTVGALRDRYATALGRADVPAGASFTSLGGDSLSYVDVSLGLEEIIGTLPDGWQSMPIARLATLADERGDPDERPPGRPAWRTIETSVALRAVAILLVVATHIGMIGVPGGAHVLMAVAGFNFARFRLTDAGRVERVRSQLRSIARIAVPAMAWVALAMLFLGEYELRHLLLVNALVNDELWGNLWFIELLVYIGLLMAAILAVPALDRAERRRPFAFALAVLGIGLAIRFEVLDPAVPYTKPVLWLFAIGWLASRADRTWQRLLVLGVTAWAVSGYFDETWRNAVILAGVALLVLLPTVRVPSAVARVAALLAAASLFIYLVHWEVWPMFHGWYGLPSLGGSVAAGIVVWLVASRAPRLLAGAWRGLRSWADESGPIVRRPADGRPG